MIFFQKLRSSVVPQKPVLAKSKYLYHRAGDVWVTESELMTFLRCILYKLTTPKIPTKVMAMVMSIGSERFATGRTSFLGNKFFSSSLNKESGVGLLQFKAVTKSKKKTGTGTNIHNTLNLRTYTNNCNAKYEMSKAKCLILLWRSMKQKMISSVSFIPAISSVLFKTPCYLYDKWKKWSQITEYEDKWFSSSDLLQKLILTLQYCTLGHGFSLSLCLQMCVDLII